MKYQTGKKKIKELYTALAGIPAVSGSESSCFDDFSSAVMSKTAFFDQEVRFGGGLFFIHHCGKSDAKKLLIDVHIDTVGFIVTEILDGGFLRVSNVGGVDARLLCASEIEIYGKKTIKGVFCSTPVHLKRNEKGEQKKTEVSDIPVDTGIPTDKLKKIVSVGDYCGFVQNQAVLCDDILGGRSMDNRICASAALLSAVMMEETPPGCDIILSLSCGEETGSGPMSYLSDIGADGALVLDVNFGREKGVPEYFSYELGEGCGVSYSSVTHRGFTDALVSCARENGIPLSTMVESRDTGTNANRLSNAGYGIPCAVLSIPEKYMHQAFECVSLSDVFAMSFLISEFAKNFADIASDMERGRIVKKAEVQDEL